MNNIIPTEAELKILQVIWDLGEARVKEIHEIMDKNKNVGYTTVLKTMQIMFEKGLLDRRIDGKSHIYNAQIKKGEVEHKLLDRILNSVYKGSAYDLVMSALGNYSASENELEKIKELIKKQQEKLT